MYHKEIIFRCSSSGVIFAGRIWAPMSTEWSPKHSRLGKASCWLPRNSDTAFSYEAAHRGWVFPWKLTAYCFNLWTKALVILPQNFWSKTFLASNISPTKLYTLAQLLLKDPSVSLLQAFDKGSGVVLTAWKDWQRVLWLQEAISLTASFWATQ